MISEAQKRASAKYVKENVSRKTISFYPAERDILEWTNAQGNVNGYIKQLIREDMEMRRNEA